MLSKAISLLLCLLLITAIKITACGAAQYDKAVLSGIELGFYKTDIEYVKCSLNEPFDPERNDYTASVEQSYTASMFITPSVSNHAPGNKVTINGVNAIPGERYRLEMKMGDNPVQIAVTKDGGEANSYSLNIVRKDLSTVYTSELIGKGIWRITDFGGFVGNENMYLVEGSSKALLFDTGMGKGDLAAFVMSLTALPVEVAISHGARDHHGQLDQFRNNKVYYPANDIGSLPEALKTNKIILIKEGDKIDLGGRVFEVIEVPGHSKGHVVYLDEANNLAMSGDILGSGDKVYMQGNNRTSVETYMNSLKHLESRVAKMNGLTLLVGHHYQTKIPLKGVAGMYYNPDLK